MHVSSCLQPWRFRGWTQGTRLAAGTFTRWAVPSAWKQQQILTSSIHITEENGRLFLTDIINLAFHTSQVISLCLHVTVCCEIWAALVNLNSEKTVPETRKNLDLGRLWVSPEFLIEFPLAKGMRNKIAFRKSNQGPVHPPAPGKHNGLAHGCHSSWLSVPCSISCQRLWVVRDYHFSEWPCWCVYRHVSMVHL